MHDNGRGVIRHRERARQLVDYSGMRFERNITPTDVDGLWAGAYDAVPVPVPGLLEFSGHHVFLFEFKLEGAPMPNGQRMALERVVGGLQRGGDFAYAIVCEHNEHDPARDIDAATATVVRIYHNRKWWGGAGRQLRQTIDCIRRGEWTPEPYVPSRALAVEGVTV